MKVFKRYPAIFRRLAEGHVDIADAKAESIGGARASYAAMYRAYSMAKCVSAWYKWRTPLKEFEEKEARRAEFRREIGWATKRPRRYARSACVISMMARNNEIIPAGMKVSIVNVSHMSAVSVRLIAQAIEAFDARDVY